MYGKATSAHQDCLSIIVGHRRAGTGRYTVHVPDVQHYTNASFLRHWYFAFSNMKSAMHVKISSPKPIQFKLRRSALDCFSYVFAAAAATAFRLA